MTADHVAHSPWWYRRRGSAIGAIYGLGFAIGSLPFGGSAQLPSSIVWGLRFDGGHGSTILLWIAVASALVAWLWRASGTAYLRQDVVFANDVRSDRLIVAGPFRYVRNPLYLGKMFLALSMALLAPPIGFAIILIGNAAFAGMLASEEARSMTARYGPVYEAFRMSVPAFVPRLTPAAAVAGSVEVEPSWRHGLLREAFGVLLAVAIAPIAVYGEVGVGAFWAIAIPTFAVYAAWGWYAGRRHR